MKIEEYLDLPYSRVVIPDKATETYTAYIQEFPGCIAQADTVEDAYSQLENVAYCWIDSALSLGQTIPPPFSVNEYGGKIALRLPKSLHKAVSIAAERDGTSLNQFIVMAVSEKLGASNYYQYLVDNFELQLARTAIEVTNTLLKTNIQISTFNADVRGTTDSFVASESLLVAGRN